jgi:hypothetical protein
MASRSMSSRVKQNPRPHLWQSFPKPWPAMHVKADRPGSGKAEGWKAAYPPTLKSTIRKRSGDHLPLPYSCFDNPGRCGGRPARGRPEPEESSEQDLRP